ncbi:DEAD/DEAH box helicase [Shewanella sp. JNE10-2]|uniref:DEAD/DEAH box helicase n=1 Tax=Shewanella TaxID=22 RepID=UPI000E067D7E|nr:MULTISPECIES: DEAD/DEAH box helicase [Shewanella]MCK7629816.1 DEAD/DEAH box helicase [Shewanella sp. JNE9-1]MCK7633706.1 DEAD/DEAH box helicase [Shewanella sp. JNE17]MCK7644986.1 DEAD/DEAH box helicase [Shewanella sp. JNE3-1]MCK7648911.1 DEAD/DEAH box helicase [Shewanella sp. JNE8]MCK7653119.1 DEAD/DEAH box helicase [Shewanella sp. JNE4-1]
MQFTDFSLDQRLLQSLKHMGITAPTAIQEQALPIALAGKDLMASSKTGSGKTLAFLLPALQRVISTRSLSKRDPRVLILLPTRELAHQVYSQLRLLVANTQYKAISVLGGENFNDQAKALAKEPHFIVATPGRIADHLEQKHLFLNGLELLILDEADRMLDLGFAPQLKTINEAADHKRRQTLMFSATLDHSEINDIAATLLKNPAHVAIDASHSEHNDIHQRIFLCDHLDHKEALLTRLLQDETHKQVIVFTATRPDTERLAAKLSTQGFATAALSGDLKQAARNQIMDQFARGQQQILVTTDVASRGLDLLNVSLVINFDMPKFAEEYVHRIGRTGRAGAKGDAISLVGPKDWDNFKKVQIFLRKTFEISVIPGLEAKFSGLKELSKQTPIKRVAKTSTSAGKTKAKTVKAPPSRDKRFITGVDIGDAPMRRKPTAPLLQDNDTEEV